MSLKRIYFDVHLELPDASVATHRICYSHGDRLRAELEANQRRIPLTASYNTTSIGIWCALVREGLFTQGYDKFVEQVIDWDSVDPTAHALPETVDPTQPAAAGSPSSSAATSPASTGSTPTSTNG